MRDSISFQILFCVFNIFPSNSTNKQLSPLLSLQGKQRRPVERRESSRLQSAAKLLRSLSKTKDVKSSLSPEGAGQLKVTKTESSPADLPDFPERGHPAYLSEGKGPRKRKNSGKENKDGKGKDRSHSFHGKMDKKERKYLALERHQKPEEPVRSEETVVSGARSILLTEDNLNPISLQSSPDLIQDLPTPEEAAAEKEASCVASPTSLASPEDDDYVEADSVLLDISEVESDKVGLGETVGSPR